jgi:hypothetical protein
MASERAPEPLPVVPEPDRPRVRRWARIVAKSLAVAGVILVAGSVGLYFAVRGPTDALNTFLSDLAARRDAQAWTQLCAADRREVSEEAFVSAWRRQRARYGASIVKIDAYTFAPFGDSRRMHYRLAYRDDKVQANTYSVDVVREDGRWKVCRFFSLSHDPEKPGPLSGFQNR